MYSFLKRVISDITLSLKVPSALALALEVISGLQIIHLILKVMTDYAEDEAFFIVDFIRYGLSYIGEISPNSLFGEPVNVLMLVWVLFAAYFLLHLVMIVYTIISARFFSRERGHRMVFTFVSWLYLVHSKIIFFIAHFFFMGLINNYDQCRVEGNSSFYCKIGWFAANIILCAFNIGLAAMKELLFYQILKTKDQYAVKDNLVNQILLIHKGVLILISFLVQDNASRAQVCAIMHLFFTLLTLMVLFMKFPFYNVRILKTSIVVNGIILSFCIIAVLQIMGVEKRVLDIMWTCLIPLVIKCLLIGFQMLSEQILKGDYKSTEKILFLISLLKHNNFGYIPYSMYGNNVTKGSMVANGVLVNQKFDVEKLRSFDNKKDYEEKIYLHIVEKLISLHDKNPSSKLLLLTMAYISLKKLDNIPRTIVLIKKLESMRLPIPISNSLDAFNQTLKRFQLKGDTEDNEKVLNLLDHFKYKEIASQIQKTMLQEVTKHIEFWEEVKREHVDVKKVVDISCDIQKCSGQVQKMQETYFRPFTQHFVNPLMMYGVYLELVKEYSDDARKLIKQFWSLTRGQARGQGLDVYCEEVGIAVISIEKGNLGAITDTSGSMQTLFQIDKQKLIGQQLTSLLPEFAANYLIKVIRNYAKIPTRKLNCNFATLGKILHDGTFFEVEVELKLFPKIDREVKLMVVFRKIAAPKPIIIVATDGTIVEASDMLKNSLNINPLRTESVNIAILKISIFGRQPRDDSLEIKDISPDFDRINNAFNHEYSNEEGVEILRSFSTKKFSVVGGGTRHSNSRGTLINQGSRGNTLSLHHANTSSPMNNMDQKSSLVAKIRNHNQQLTLFSSGAQEKNTEICDEFIQGGRITILKGNNVSHSSMRNEVMYDIQVSPSQLNGEIYKILTLISREEDKVSSFVMFPHKQQLLFTKIEETEQSGFADEFSEIDERKPEARFIHQQTKKSQMTMQQSRMVSGISDDTKGSQNKPKESVKTPDLDPFIKAHAPSKRIYAKLQDQERSVSSTSSRTMASVKALKTIFQRNRTFVLSFRTTFGMLLIVVLMISLGIYNYSLSRKAVQQVETGVSIVNLASLRLSQTMRGWQYGTRIWLRYLGLRTGQIGTLKSSMWSFGQAMLEYNRQFADEMANLSDESLFNEIMAPNIHLWELNETYTTTGAGTDSITATNILANILVFIGNTTMDLTEPYVRQISTYLCNNTANDYLVFSESLIAATQRMLDDTLSRNINSLQLILGFEIAAVEILCIVLLISARIVVQYYQKLFRAFVKIDERFTIERLHQVHKMRNLLNEDIEIRGFGVTIIEDSKTKFDFFKEKSKDGKGNFRKVGVFQKRNENLILRRLYIDLGKYIFVSFVFIQIITCIFVVSLTQSLDNFRNSQDVTNQLSVTTKAAYTSSVTVSTVYMDMDFRNWTEMKVRNQAPASQITKVINDISQTNTDLTSVFSKEGEGLTDPFIAEIFEGTICKYLLQDVTTQGYCATATNYGELGLLSMNSKLLAAENSYVTKYLATPTWQTAFDILDGYVAIMRPVAETLEAVYELINSHIIDNFEQTTKDFLTQIGILHLGILIAILVSAVVVQTVTIKRIRFLDTCRGNVLNTLSYKMLVEDKAIGFYLSRNFVNADAAISRTM